MPPRSGSSGRYRESWKSIWSCRSSRQLVDGLRRRQMLQQLGVVEAGNGDCRMTVERIGLRFGDSVQDITALDDVEAEIVLGRVDGQHDVIGSNHVAERGGLVVGEVDENANVCCELAQLFKIGHGATPTQLTNRNL